MNNDLQAAPFYNDSYPILYVTGTFIYGKPVRQIDSCNGIKFTVTLSVL
jgi:hypothetical protein